MLGRGHRPADHRAGQRPGRLPGAGAAADGRADARPCRARSARRPGPRSRRPAAPGSPHPADAVIDRLVDEFDRKGRSGGAGFYEYVGRQAGRAVAGAAHRVRGHRPRRRPGRAVRADAVRSRRWRPCAASTRACSPRCRTPTSARSSASASRPGPAAWCSTSRAIPGGVAGFVRRGRRARRQVRPPLRRARRACAPGPPPPPRSRPRQGRSWATARYRRNRTGAGAHWTRGRLDFRDRRPARALGRRAADPAREPDPADPVRGRAAAGRLPGQHRGAERVRGVARGHRAARCSGRCCSTGSAPGSATSGCTGWPDTGGSSWPASTTSTAGTSCSTGTAARSCCSRAACRSCAAWCPSRPACSGMPVLRFTMLTAIGMPVADVVDGARIRLDNLQAENQVTVTGTALYSRTGEGMHRFVDPADGAVLPLHPVRARRRPPGVRELRAARPQGASSPSRSWRPSGWQVASNGARPPAPG